MKLFSVYTNFLKNEISYLDVRRRRRNLSYERRQKYH